MQTGEARRGMGVGETSVLTSSAVKKLFISLGYIYLKFPLIIPTLIPNLIPTGEFPLGILFKKWEFFKKELSLLNRKWELKWEL